MNKSLIILAGIFSCGIASADIAEGERISQDVCYDCHFVDEGEMAELGATFKSIKGIVDGTVKHRKKLKLTDEEIKSLIEYFSTFEQGE